VTTAMNLQSEATRVRCPLELSAPGTGAADHLGQRHLRPIALAAAALTIVGASWLATHLCCVGVASASPPVATSEWWCSLADHGQ
jgi:hypothetical protein